MAGLPDMGKMIGPLPLGAWLAVIGGGLGIAVYTRRQGDVPTDDTAGRNVDENPGVGTGGSGQWIDLNPPAPTGSIGDPATNEEWARKATTTLIGLGYPAINADQAIRRYVASETLAANEAAMVNAAIAAIGPTPQILPPPTTGVPTGPPPTSNPARKPYTYHTVQVTENFAIIALKYKKNPADIWNANKKGIIRLDGSVGILSDYRLGRGWVLVIPWVTPVNKGTDPKYKKSLGING